MYTYVCSVKFALVDKITCRNMRNGCWKLKHVTWIIFVCSPCPISVPPCESRTEPSV